MLKYILPVIPAHDTYIEPFAGGLAVFLAKERVKLEVVNDLNHEVGNFYLYVREHYESLLREMSDYLHSTDIFRAFLENQGLTELQRVARWFLLKVSSFSGYGDTFARDPRGYRGYTPEKFESKIAELHERLRGVVIDSRDWERVVKFYDKPSAFIYFDPPYCTGDSGIYDAFSPNDMERLRNELYTLKGKWLLSCDGSDICREIFADFAHVEVPYRYTSGTQYVGRPIKSEMLVACDALADALHRNFKAVESSKNRGVSLPPPPKNASKRCSAWRKTA